MNPYKRHMTQDVTYWEHIGRDKFDKSMFAQPQVFKCRWENKAVLFRDNQGQEFISSSIIYPEAELKLKGYVYRGVSYLDNPIGLEGTNEIRWVGDSPNLRGTETLHKVVV